MANLHSSSSSLFLYADTQASPWQSKNRSPAEIANDTAADLSCRMHDPDFSFDDVDPLVLHQLDDTGKNMLLIAAIHANCVENVRKLVALQVEDSGDHGKALVQDLVRRVQGDKERTAKLEAIYRILEPRGSSAGPEPITGRDDNLRRAVLRCNPWLPRQLAADEVRPLLFDHDEGLLGPLTYLAADSGGDPNFETVARRLLRAAAPFEAQAILGMLPNANLQKALPVIARLAPYLLRARPDVFSAALGHVCTDIASTDGDDSPPPDPRLIRRYFDAGVPLDVPHGHANPIHAAAFQWQLGDLKVFLKLASPEQINAEHDGSSPLIRLAHMCCWIREAVEQAYARSRAEGEIFEAGVAQQFVGCVQALVQAGADVRRDEAAFFERLDVSYRSSVDVSPECLHGAIWNPVRARVKAIFRQASQADSDQPLG